MLIAADDVQHTLVDNFDSVSSHTAMLRSWHRIGMHLLGKIEPLIKINEERLGQHTSTRGAAQDLREWNQVPASYFRELVRLPPLRQNAPLVTDDRPYLEFSLLRSRRSRVKKLHPPVYWYKSFSDPYRL